MEDSRPLIRKLGHGQCQLCGHSLIVLESETVEYKLNDNGVPVSYDMLNYNTRAFCGNCGKVHNVVKMGFSYVPDCKLLKHFENEKLLKSENCKVKDNTSNPFIVASKIVERM